MSEHSPTSSSVSSSEAPKPCYKCKQPVRVSGGGMLLHPTEDRPHSCGEAASLSGTPEQTVAPGEIEQRLCEINERIALLERERPHGIVLADLQFLRAQLRAAKSAETPFAEAMRVAAWMFNSIVGGQISAENVERWRATLNSLKERAPVIGAHLSRSASPASSDVLTETALDAKLRGVMDLLESWGQHFDDKARHDSFPKSQRVKLNRKTASDFRDARNTVDAARVALIAAPVPPSASSDEDTGTTEHDEQACDYAKEVQSVSELLTDFDPTDRFPSVSAHLADLLSRFARSARTPESSPAVPEVTILGVPDRVYTAEEFAATARAMARPNAVDMDAADETAMRLEATTTTFVDHDLWNLAGAYLALRSSPAVDADDDFDWAGIVANARACVEGSDYADYGHMSDMTWAQLILRVDAMLRAARSPAVDDETVSVDWTEDFAHENGRYIRKCFSCGREFTGHKRRVTCKRCAA